MGTFSFDDLVFDYKQVEDIALRWRKEIGKKYGLDTGRTGVIQEAILIKMREERHTRKEFTEEDVIWFNRLEGNIRKKIDFEPIEFVEFLKKLYWQKLEDKKLVEKIPMVKGRDWNYFMTATQREFINSYLFICEWLESKDPNAIKAQLEKDNIIKSITTILINQTTDFHTEFINRADKWARLTHKKMTEMYEKYSEKYNELTAQMRALGTSFVANSPEYEAYRKLYDERAVFTKAMNKARLVAQCSLDDFVKKTIAEAEMTFNKNINTLAYKISEKNIDVQMMKVSHIEDDPKFFEMLISDGKIGLYARSIWAAEWSEKVTPHFRFIITDRKMTSKN